jgi:hypothetical protein
MKPCVLLHVAEKGLQLTPLLIVLVLSSAALVPATYAGAGAYMIPLEGGRWNTETINVSVPNAPKWAHDAVVDVLRTWVQTQLWFAQNYFPSGQTYNLAISSHGNDSGTTQVFVQFIDANASYVGKANVVYLTKSRTITSATAILPQSYAGQPLDASYAPWFTKLAIRVFGHILGLDWVGFCDVMQQGDGASCSANMPSTLDLYAVHILAQGSVPNNVTLPSAIPYQTMPRASDGFLSSPIIVILASVGLISCGAASARKHEGTHLGDSISKAAREE